MIVCIISNHWVFIDQNGQMVPDKVTAVSFRGDVILVNRFSEAPEEGIATKDMYLVCLSIFSGLAALMSADIARGL